MVRYLFQIQKIHYLSHKRTWTDLLFSRNRSLDWILDIFFIIDHSEENGENPACEMLKSFLPNVFTRARVHICVCNVLVRWYVARDRVLVPTVGRKQRTNAAIKVAVYRRMSWLEQQRIKPRPASAAACWDIHSRTANVRTHTAPPAE
jgi:hypothetical protein